MLRANIGKTNGDNLADEVWYSWPLKCLYHDEFVRCIKMHSKRLPVGGQEGRCRGDHKSSSELKVYA